MVVNRHDREEHVNPSSTAQELSLELVRRAQGGDTKALRALLKEAYPIVRRWALVRTGDPTEADDLTEDVLVQVMERLDAFQGAGRFTTWLYTVVRRAAADRFRRRARRRTVERDHRTLVGLLGDHPASPHQTTEGAETLALVEPFFDLLPPRQREIFDLADLQGLTSTEIAHRLGIEAVSVRANLFKARRTLRERILARHPHLAGEAPHDL